MHKRTSSLLFCIFLFFYLAMFTVIILVFCFMFQFHTADILWKRLPREGWVLKCFLLAKACFNHVRMIANILIWWFRAHVSKDWRTEETDSFSQNALLCFAFWSQFFMAPKYLVKIEPAAQSVSSTAEVRSWVLRTYGTYFSSNLLSPVLHFKGD